MPPKRKSKPAASTSNATKKSKGEEVPKDPAPAPSPKSKSLGGKTVSEVWSTATYVSGGKISQEGFATFISDIGIEDMSFEAIYLSFRLSTSDQAVEDVFTVCASKQRLQFALDGLGCRSFAELPAKLRAKRVSLQSEYGQQFAAFFRWLFEMGKAIAALNNSVASQAVRTVPLSEGLALMEAVLGAWPLMEQLKTFCLEKFNQPFSKDLWTQIGRFVNMTKTGQIQADLSNYDADGDAWPSAIDEFVEFVQEASAT